MKQLAPLTLALAVTLVQPLAPSAALAQDTADPSVEEDGLDLMEEGAKLLFRGLMSEMEPAIRELEDLATEMGPAMQLFADEMGPALAQLMSQIDDIRNYEPPELMPNGDIVMRRRAEAPPYEAPEIDL